MKDLSDSRKLSLYSSKICVPRREGGTRVSSVLLCCARRSLRPSPTERGAMSAEARPDVRVKAATRRLGVIGSILLGRSFRNQSSKDMAFPHPQSRKDHYRKEDIPSWGGIVRKFFKRTIDI